MNPLATAEFENNKEALVENSVAVPVVAESQPAIVEPAPEPVIAETVTAIPAENYMLVAGSFKSEVNAKVLMNRLIEKGYLPKLVEASNGFFRVSAVTVNDLNTALSLKETIEKEFPGTWIHKEK